MIISCKKIWVLIIFVFSTNALFAAHFYGVDLFYTHMSGNSYKVILVAFGDCSSNTFRNFPKSKPQIYLSKGGVVIDSFSLIPEPPYEGIEVTPVCPKDSNNTTCVDPLGSIPGVKKFVYSNEYKLNSIASDWKFIFKGGMGSSAVAAGRSFTITNILAQGVITLEAELDNTQTANSSPIYTTIATPFYCINQSTNFNPGAVDSDGDSLVYELVTGLDGDTHVQYLPGFTGSNPLATSRGTFNFSKITGQLSFVPNQLQKSLVVYKVSEFRNGVLIGTSMREMTVVIMPCNNHPPMGYISDAFGVTVIDSVTVKTCKGEHSIAFSINPSDANNQIINMVVNGLPEHSTLDIKENNTLTPTSRFDWPLPDLNEGDYAFFITYTDNGCPIASKQTQAYTVRIGQEHIESKVAIADCSGKGLIELAAPSGWIPWAYKIYQDSLLLYERERIFRSMQRDSFPPGKYWVRASNNLGCQADTLLNIPFDCIIADIPTAFSPNGDGNNDILYVRGEGIQEIYLKIYNRWGELVFESHDINMGWDGKYKGADAPVEAYGYVLSVLFVNNQIFQKAGNITLIR